MKLYGNAVALLLTTALGAGAQETLYVDAGSKGHDINPGMYGIFFEEINHSGDGGLYAELLQNRGFEEQVLPGGFHQSGTNKIQTENVTEYLNLTKRQLTWDWNFAAKKMTGWKIDNKNCTVAHDVLTPAKPLHENTPNAMNLKITNSSANPEVRLINTGYWGINVEKDGKYDLRFYLNTADYAGKVKAVIYNNDCTKALGQVEFDVDKSGEWKEYKAVMTSSETLKDAQFALIFSGNGEIDVDYVSLFPQDTFMGRANGMRKDVAQLLADLQPKFMRWPGGCIVEGITLDNRVKWKETLGDPMTRRGEYDLWGYRSTWGMGYHEILQFCEDTGMECMFVGNAGLACIGSLGEYVSGAEALEPYYQDIKDAIEYAIGDPATNEWAKRRADAGHPAPFPLKYVEIGNENFTKRYDDNFHYIYNKLKAEYPQLIFLNTMGIDHAEEFNLRLGSDMIDPHWYVTPEYFYNSRTIFDKTPRGHYDIYVGEYAVNAQVGDGNMDAALSEASFMIDMERNSDIVKMASYAPLIQNDNAINWHCNLIWQHSGESLGRASYYNQKMFSENRPSYNVKNDLHSDRCGVAYNGRAGIGTWSTVGQFRNFKVSDHEGKVLYTADFNTRPEEWTGMQGTWTLNSSGNYQQSTTQTRCISLMNTLAFRDGVIEVEAMKTAGNEGFLLVFGCDENDWNHYYQLNIGGWSNTAIGIEDVNDGSGAVISEKPSFKVSNNQWYKIKVVLKEGKVEAYVDDKLYCTAEFGKLTAGRINYHTGYDADKGEIVVKVVNAEKEALPLTLALNAKNIASTATAETLKSESLWFENSYSEPEMIAPVKSTVSGVGETFKYTFEPYSLTVLRIKADPAAEAMNIPAQVYTTTPKELDASLTQKGKAADLKAMIAEAKSVMLSDVEGYDALRVATEAAEAELKSNDATKIAAAIDPMKKALDTYYKGLMIAANEVTDKIQNPDFKTAGDNSGWRGSAMAVRANVAEVFNSRFMVYQDVENLENGWYMVYCQGYYRNGSHPDSNAAHANGTEELLAKFSLNDMEKPVVSLMGEVHDGYWWGAPNSMEEANTVFKQSPDYYANYLLTHVDNGKLRIAFTKDDIKDSDWFLFSNVKMYKVNSESAGILTVEEAITTFSPEAKLYDLQGRYLGSYAGLQRLAPGVYVISENGRSAKIRK